MTTQARPSSRNTALDGLRGLAAVLVVLYRYVLRYDELYTHQGLGFDTGWAVIGKYGVHLFFMISGFVIYWTLSRTHTARDFLVSRFARLYPAYWAAAIITWCIVTTWGPADRHVSAVHALMNIPMLQEYAHIPHIDGVYWTLTMELTFYFYAFLLWKTGLLRRFELVALTFIALVAAVNLGWIPWHQFLSKVMLFDYGSFFLVGMAFYKLKQADHSPLTWLTWVAAMLLPFTSGSAGSPAIIIAVYAVFFFALKGWLPFLSSKPLLYLGTISYTLYLLHQNIGYTVMLQLERWGLPSVLSILLALISSIILARLVTVWVEQPAQPFLKRRLRTNTVAKA